MLLLAPFLAVLAALAALAALADLVSFEIFPKIDIQVKRDDKVEPCLVQDRAAVHRKTVFADASFKMVDRILSASCLKATFNAWRFFTFAATICDASIFWTRGWLIFL